jgi:carbon catabolite-derepressing protein kinase
MDQRDRERARRSPPDVRQDAPDDPDSRTERSAEEQQATARALKPHSRSIVDLGKLRLEPPESLAQVPSQPKRGRRWQFGIRSRNQPYEAMLCLYKALRQQGGVWEIQPAEPGEFTNRYLTSLLN